MKTTKSLVILLTPFAIGTVVGCSRFFAKSPMFRTAFVNHLIKRASKTSPLVRIVTRAS